MAHAHTEHHDHAHHAIPVKRLLTTFAWLVFLTAFTVFTGTADWVPGFLHIPLALSIAALKCYLVVSFFMGLKYDKPVNMLAFVMSGVFVLIFLTFTLFDTANRGDLGNVDPRTIMDEVAIAREDSVTMQQYDKLMVTAADSATVHGAAPEAASTDSSATPVAPAPADSAATSTSAPAPAAH